MDLARAIDVLRGVPGEPRWTSPDRWHLTLLFLGSVPDDRLDRLITAGAAAVRGTPPMTLRLAGAGRFGSIRRPQVLWTGLDGDVQPLVELADRLHTAAGKLGLSLEDRPFRPHLTLGRWRPGRPADGTLPDRLAGYRGPAWPAAELRLLQSHLGRDAHYEQLAAWPL